MLKLNKNQQNYCQLFRNYIFLFLKFYKFLNNGLV